MLIIDNVKSKYLGEDIVSKFASLVRSEMSLYNVECTFKTSTNGLCFNYVKDKNVFASTKEHKIPLKEDSPLRAKLKRDYMLTHRLSEKQWRQVNNLIIGTMDKLNIEATVMYKNDEEEIKIREGLVNYKDLILDKRPPKEE